MKKISICIILLLALCLIFVGCRGAGGEDTTAPPTETTSAEITVEETNSESETTACTHPDMVTLEVVTKCTENYYIESHCTLCDHTERDLMPPYGHRFADGVCEICGAADESAETTAHVHVLATTENVPTCTEGAMVISFCACGYTSNEEIPPLGHEFKDGACTRCGEKEKVSDGSQGLEYRIDGDHAVLVGIGTCTDKDIIIASTYNGLPVTEIGRKAIWSHDGITSIIIPDTVTHMDFMAISHCHDLESIHIPANLTVIEERAIIAFKNLKSITVDPNNPRYYSINNCLIDRDTKTLILGCGKSIMPDDGSIIAIAPNAFMECPDIENIRIPEGVTKIGRDAFYNCTALKSLVLPESLITIESSAFANCTSLESVKLGGKIEYMDDYAFSECVKLTEIVLPDSLNFLGNFAFQCCTALKRAVLSSNLETLNLMIFSSCTRLESVIIPEGVKTIGTDAFSSTALKEITLPASIKTIQRDAFGYCDSLMSVSFAGTVSQWIAIEKDLGWHTVGTFKVIRCSDGDVSVNETDGTPGLSYGVSKDGKTAFLAGIGIFDGTEIVVSAEYNGLPVTSIAYRVIRNAPNLTSVYISKNVTDLPEELFYECDKVVNLTVDPENPVYRSEGNCIIEKETGKLVFGCNGSVTPEGVKSIGESAFASCKSIKSLTLPEGIEIIEPRAFSGCTSLSSITLPESLEYVGEYAFANCSSLKSIVFGSKIQSIGAYAFNECTALTGVSLPDTVTLGDFAFLNCSSLKSIKLPAAQTSLAGTFFGCTALESVILPEALTSLLGSTFGGCVSLKSIDLPASVREIQGGDFADCISLTDFAFGGTVAEWDSINKQYWMEGAAFTTVKCSDGNVYLSLLTESDALESARKFWNLPANAVLYLKEKSPSNPFCYKVAYCELTYADFIGNFEVKREVFVDQRTGECTEVVYQYPEIPEIFLDVIFNREKFLYVEQTVNSAGEYSYTATEALFKDFRVHYETIFGTQSLGYYVTDIDGDSIPELIFPGMAREKYGILLRVYEGKIYGYACLLDGLHTDATYFWSEQAGCYSGRSQVYFDGIFYKSRGLTAIDINDPNNVKYYVEGNQTTKEKYDEAESAYSNEVLQYYILDYYPVYVNPFPGG